MYKNEDLKKPIHREMSGRFAGLTVKTTGVYGIQDNGQAEDFVFAVCPDRKHSRTPRRIIRQFYANEGVVQIEFDPKMVSSEQIRDALRKI